MSDRKTQIIKELDEARANFKRLAERLTPQDWETPVQDADQRWTAHQMLIHLVDSQRGMMGQMTRISAGQEGVPPDFDLSRWNVRHVQKNAEKTVPELLTELDEGQIALRKTVNDLTDAALDKQGRHSSLEIMSVEQIARLIASHEAEHTQIIADRLGLSV